MPAAAPPPSDPSAPEGAGAAGTGDTPLLSPEAHARLRVALGASAELYGEHGLDLPAFEARVASLAAAQLRRLGLAVEAAGLCACVERAALADLALACACEAGSASAWASFTRAFGPRLEGFAVRRGLCSPDAEALVGDVLGDLAAPPPRGATRTLLGTYDGSGSLFGWLSVVVLRRIAGQARRRRPQALEALGAEREQDLAPHRAARPPTPSAAVESAETAARFAAAFAAAFDALKAQQRLALVLKHRDGCSQREVAALLGVGEARVSGVVSAAVATLVERLGSLAPPDAPADETAWQSCAAAIARHLASSPATGVPPAGRTGASAGTPQASPPPEGA